MGFVLRNAELWPGPGGAGDVRVSRGRIAEIGRGLAPRRREIAVDLADHLLLPGLINAHDHLGLDLLPQMGSPPYTSFYDWAEDVYRPQESPIVELERTPIADRLAWGGWRNVLGGVTTVIHHDPWHRRVFASPSFPAGVVRCAWAHSLGIEPDIRRRFRRDRTFVVHAAEGTDERAAGEIAELERLGLLADNTVVVHAIAVSAADVARLVRHRTSVVWCPASNQRLYGRTAPVAELRRAGVEVVLGTDSTMSGEITLLDELRAAARTDEVAPEDLLAMVGERAARVFGLGDGRGRLELGGTADLVAIPRLPASSAGGADDGERRSARALLAARTRDLALVTVRGTARLAHPEVAAALRVDLAEATIDGARVAIDRRFGRLRDRLDRTLGATWPHGPLWRLAQ